jgi:hypothetical protein
MCAFAHARIARNVVVFVIEPAIKPTTAKAGTVHGELSFDCLQRIGGFDNQRFQHGGSFFIFQHVKD